ncbi:BMP family ABC transporter substrate-binding protein [Georgenia sp. H159]|uniref:BMP family lipoprotein n=1 Tax=Georgenia sp. H159 TaxID=3076115 RepID=UPI002D765F9C|nr:BMP family ABC transporter substrate-binding protein [Georgenia sp. H159]
MKKSIYATALAAVATLALAACGDAPEDDSPEPAGDATTTAADTETGDAGDDAASDFLACLISDQGGWDDQSFNQSAMEGGQRAEAELGIQLNNAESQSDADFGPNVDSMVQQGCDITVGVGFLLEDPIQGAAEANPDLNFGLVDATFSEGDPPEPVELDNAKPIIFNTAEAAFLGGYLAAGMTETGTVATFGGLPIPSVSIFMDGFVDGVAKYNEDNGADVTVLGWDKEAQDGTFSGGFEDQGQGQALTEGFIAQGADIIMPVAGPVGLGAAAAAENAGNAWIVGVDSDWTQSTDYADIILGSVVKEIGAGVFETIEEAVNGSFSGEPYVGDLANGGVSLALGTAEVPQELQDQLDALQEQIVSGELMVESPNSP